MNKKHPAKSQPMVNTPASSPSMGESERKKLELGEAMEHEHGQARENTEEEIESLDSGGKRRGKR